VAALQTPADAINGMHSLLAAAEVAPPYVLLGASFGGLLSYLYANTYPEDVVGMVLLDAMFPDEMSLEHLFPKSDRYKAFDKEDEDITLEIQPLQGATRSPAVHRQGTSDPDDVPRLGSGAVGRVRPRDPRVRRVHPRGAGRLRPSRCQQTTFGYVTGHGP
jgi:pimeloyl-ACP methyl ester carboxylesterase